MKWTSLPDCLTKSFLIDTGRGDFQWPLAPQQCLINKTIGHFVWYMNVALLTHTHIHTHMRTHTHTTCIHACMHIHHACTYSRTRAHTHTEFILQIFGDISPCFACFFFSDGKKKGVDLYSHLVHIVCK